MKLKEFKHEIKKDICNHPMDEFIHNGHSGDNHTIVLTFFEPKSYDPDANGVLIDMTVSENTVEATTSAWLTNKECLELAKILTKYAKRKAKK
jgi:hypothetical protein